MWEMTLTKSNDPKVLVGFINCLSVMEENAFLLYKALSDKIELPLVKSFLLSIAEDSHKHPLLLKGVVDSMATQEKPRDCAKKPAKHGPSSTLSTKKYPPKKK
jgi:rubrerythrin